MGSTRRRLAAIGIIIGLTSTLALAPPAEATVPSICVAWRYFGYDAFAVGGPWSYSGYTISGGSAETISWTIQWGDGTSNTLNERGSLQHIYTTPGSGPVIASAECTYRDTDGTIVPRSDPPTEIDYFERYLLEPAFELGIVQPQGGSPQLVANGAKSITRDYITNFGWTFPDPAVAAAAEATATGVEASSPVHQCGTQSVQLAITDGDDYTKTKSKTVEADAKTVPPRVTSAVASPGFVLVNKDAMKINASWQGCQVTEIEWDFGDDVKVVKPVAATTALTGSAQSPNHKYGTVGIKEPRVRIKDVNGVWSSYMNAGSVSVGFTIETVLPRPTNVVAVAGNRRITVSFDPPEGSASPIVNYAVTCRSSTGGATRSADGPNSPIEVVGVTNGAKYTCTVVGQNANGGGRKSTPSNEVTPIGEPLPPQLPVASASGQVANIDFFPPTSDGGSPITGYSANCRSSDGGKARSGSGAASPVTVGRLGIGKTYTCSVKATNAIGTSKASTSTKPFVVGAPTAPGAPQGAAATPLPAGLRVTFTPPISDGGSKILSYTAACTSSNGGPPGSATKAKSPIDVTSLWSGYTYTCTVTAKNDVGIGAKSSPTAAAVPGFGPIRAAPVAGEGAEVTSGR